MRVTPRLLLLTAILTGALAVYQFVGAAIALQRGVLGFAVFYGLFGLAGLAIARALLSVRASLRRPPS
jgi:uncharacterized membrane protein YkvI